MDHAHEIRVERLVPRLGHAQAIGAITHRLCRLIWKILHERVRHEESGPAVSAQAKKVRARKMIRELRTLGYRVELIAPTPTARGIFDPGSSERRGALQQLEKQPTRSYPVMRERADRRPSALAKQ